MKYSIRQKPENFPQNPLTDAFLKDIMSWRAKETQIFFVRII